MADPISVYDPVAALAAIDASKPLILGCLAVAAGLSFAYFIIGMRMAVRQQMYVVPFIGASWFFWHDLSYVLHYPLWWGVYGGHWWLKLWTYAQVGTVALEAYLIGQFIRYGRKELMPEVSQATFTVLVLLATGAVGVLWWLIKESLADELFLISQVITVVWAVPFNTAMLYRRKTQAGQSVAMQLCLLPMFAAMCTVCWIAAPDFFGRPAFMAFFAVFMAWPLVQIWLIRRYPPHATPVHS